MLKKIILTIVAILVCVSLFILHHFGFLFVKVDTWQCEHGYYKTYPHETSDGVARYYNAFGIPVGTCRSFWPSQSCNAAKNLAGECASQKTVGINVQLIDLVFSIFKGSIALIMK